MTQLLGDSFAAFVSEQVFEAIPDNVVERAKLLMLDSIGIAIAAGRYDFAKKTLAGLAQFGTGDFVGALGETLEWGAALS